MKTRSKNKRNIRNEVVKTKNKNTRNDYNDVPSKKDLDLLNFSNAGIRTGTDNDNGKEDISSDDRFLNNIIGSGNATPQAPVPNCDAGTWTRKDNDNSKEHISSDDFF